MAQPDRLQGVLDESGKIFFKIFYSLTHLRLVGVALVQTDDPAERAGDMREEPLRHFEPHALGLHRRGIGSAKVVQRPGRDLAKLVELEGRFGEAVEGTVGSPCREEEAFG